MCRKPTMLLRRIAVLLAGAWLLAVNAIFLYGRLADSSIAARVRQALESTLWSR